MKITTFKNKKGLIHGRDPKRIACKMSGVLKIGTTTIDVVANEDCIFPILFYGSTGDYDATFTTTDGTVYSLGKVMVRGGRVAPPSQTAVELMELRCRADMAETERDELRAEIEKLKNIFDTNSLNFLIKGDE